MAIKISNEQFAKLHDGTFRSVLRIYWENKPIWKSWCFKWALISSVVILASVFIANQETLKILLLISTLMCSILPNILGFNLGGYVILITLNSSSILKEITDPTKGNKYSTFQHLSSVFAFGLLLQSTALIFSYLVLILHETFLEKSFSEILATTINSTVLFMSCFVCAYSLLLIIQIVLNIFNFGQIIHFFTRIEKIENDISQETNNK